MDIKSMNAEELKKLIDSKGQYTLIDCREQNEWDNGHIKEAKLLPLSNFAEEIEKFQKTNPDKNAPIILQCRSGQRSYRAAVYMAEQGYTNLTNLEGGIMGWANLDYPIEQG